MKLEAKLPFGLGYSGCPPVERWEILFIAPVLPITFLLFLDSSELMIQLKFRGSHKIHIRSLGSPFLYYDLDSNQRKKLYLNAKFPLLFFLIF